MKRVARTALAIAGALALCFTILLLIADAAPDHLKDLPGETTRVVCSYAKYGSSDPLESCTAYLNGTNFDEVEEHLAHRLPKEDGWVKTKQNEVDLKVTDFSKSLVDGDSLDVGVAQIKGSGLSVRQNRPWNRLRYIVNLIRTRGESKMVLVGPTPEKVWWP